MGKGKNRRDVARYVGMLVTHSLRGRRLQQEREDPQAALLCRDALRSLLFQEQTQKIKHTAWRGPEVLQDWTILFTSQIHCLCKIRKKKKYDQDICSDHSIKVSEINRCSISLVCCYLCSSCREQLTFSESGMGLSFLSPALVLSDCTLQWVTTEREVESDLWRPQAPTVLLTDSSDWILTAPTARNKITPPAFSSSLSMRQPLLKGREGTNII